MANIQRCSVSSAGTWSVWHGRIRDCD